MKNHLSQKVNNRLFLFIHGYTGSTSDFSDLPKVLRDTFQAEVSYPLLPGHGTSIEDLVGLTYDDLFADIERTIQKAIHAHKQVVLVGISMGAQAALYFASKYPVKGVIAIAVTHELRFPFNLSCAGIMALFKKKWKKKFTPLEQEFRAVDSTISYDEMLADGWFISRKLRSLVKANARYIIQPVLFVHSAYERLANPSAITKLRRTIRGYVAVRLLENGSHNMFYSPANEDTVAHVIAFIKDMHLFAEGIEPTREKATAIIPAYNEAGRIAAVLATLSRIPSIDEIIVVDDGSHDGTADRVRAFPKVRLLANERNIGKGASMERGVQHAKNNVIFFCDADLIGFTVAHAEAIIRPVLDRTHDMFIGMRGNFMQRAVKLWGLNSGERALRREVWQTLPSYYKYRYRIEVGLNRHVVARNPQGLGWKIFDYGQPIKESKYGILKGTILRWWMNFDVLCAYLFYPFMAVWKKDAQLAEERVGQKEA